MRPAVLKARVVAVGTCWDSGSTRVLRYAFRGSRRSAAVAFRREVHCFRAILSVHDLLRVGGASGRADMRRLLIRYRPRHARGRTRLAANDAELREIASTSKDNFSLSLSLILVPGRGGRRICGQRPGRGILLRAHG